MYRYSYGMVKGADERVVKYQLVPAAVVASHGRALLAKEVWTATQTGAEQVSPICDGGIVLAAVKADARADGLRPALTAADPTRPDCAFGRHPALVTSQLVRAVGAVILDDLAVEEAGHEDLAHGPV